METDRPDDFSRHHKYTGLPSLQCHSKTKAARWLCEFVYLPQRPGLKLVSSTAMDLKFIKHICREEDNLLTKEQPQPPMKNLLLGHLEIADECRTVFPKSAHVHLWPDYIREKCNLPEIYYVDW